MSKITKDSGRIGQYDELIARKAQVDALVVASVPQPVISASQISTVVNSSTAGSGFASGDPIPGIRTKFYPVSDNAVYNLSGTSTTTAGNHTVEFGFIGAPTFGCITGSSNTSGIQITSVVQPTVNSLSVEFTAINGVTPIISVSTVTY